MNALLYIIVAIIIILVLWLIGIYNTLIRAKNRLEESWSDITVQLKRRYDLIPNLIETVKGYAQHEKETLEKVIQARNLAMTAGNPNDKITAETNLSATLKTIFALSESYPELKANQNFLQLQEELADTENKIQAARRFYNANVRDFNTKIQTFPNRLIAGGLNFTAREFFETNEAAKENVKVNF